MADFKRLNFTSPKGVFVFPKLNDPDFGSGEYPKPNGEYSVKLKFSADDPALKAFIAQLSPLHAAAVANGEKAFKDLKAETRKKLGAVKVNDLYTTLLNQETEQPTGDVEFKFAMAAGGISKKTGKKWERKPSLFDAKGTLLKNCPPIWGGTVGKVGFTVTEGGYFIPGTGAAGLKLSLEGVQIIELRSGQGRSAKEMGFGAEEGFDGSGNEFDGSSASTDQSTVATDDSADF